MRWWWAVALVLTACRSKQGEALFTGATELKGRIVGHDTDLPTVASRCSNCHLPGTAQPVGDAGASDTFGPVLNRQTLTVDAPRRGGPASHYELASFCRLLRTGIDPADIIIARSMPRYELSEAECTAMWSYLQ